MKKHSVQFIIFLFFALLLGCEKEVKGAYIFRKQGEYFFTPPIQHPQERPPYPWEREDVGGYPRITKEFFRCRGNPLNPVVEKKREGKESFFYRDCSGSHSLPIVDGKEFIYPILIELLNFVQKELKQRIIITTGHRCPVHNTYADYSSYNYGSKHMMGAEVDFYLEGVAPEAIIDTLQKYYSTPFKRYTKGNLNVTTPAWYNDEVFIKLYLPDEGRDCDNQHPYPYIGIQVRYDQEQQKRVVFDPKQSENYLRS